MWGRKKTFEESYRNQSLYWRFTTWAPWINFKFIVKAFLWARLQGLYNMITYPWWLLQYWYSLIQRFIVWFPQFIISIPGMPKRFYLWSIFTFKNAIKRIFRDTVYLRKRTLKVNIIYHSKICFGLYLALSFTDEFRYYTNNHFAEINKLWDMIFEFGFYWAFTVVMFYLVAWILMLYFVAWRYNFKTYWLYYWWFILIYCDLNFPDMLHEWLFMIVQTNHLPTYLFCGWYSWTMNDMVEFWHAKKPLPTFKRYSWEHDHFVYRLQEDLDTDTRKKLEKTFKYIKLRDYENSWGGTL